MIDYDIAAPGRTCTATNRELKPGERFVAVLLEESGKFVRKDYAADAWPGPPEQYVAFWNGRIPPTDKARKPTFNDDLLMEWFQHLAGNPEPNRRNIRYVVALLLMRRKRLKFEDAKRQNGTDVLVLRDARTGTRHELSDPRLTEDEIAAVQDEVFQALGWT
ncbi:MAG: hypothetical protein KF873_07975 [Gemmataceae bacterium]|nr:hypothetical protein [Gemmataceae bacterium]